MLKGEQYTDVPHFAAKFAVERMIEQCDLPATILRPAYFIQNDERQKDALLTLGVYGMPIGNVGISMVDTRNIGEAAALELSRRECSAVRLSRETYALVGPEVLGGTRRRRSGARSSASPSSTAATTSTRSKDASGPSRPRGSLTTCAG